MKNTIYDGVVIKEQGAVLPGAAAGVVSAAGVVYRRFVVNSASNDYGKSYVGETIDEARRQKQFSRMIPNYSGKKMQDAMARNPDVKDWGYEVLERISAPTEKELREKLEEREAHYIKTFDSYNQGFNSNLGGTGNTGVAFDATRRAQNGANRRGKPQSDATKAAISAKLTGKSRPDDVKQKISKANKGKHRTEEMRRKQSERMKGKEPKAASEAAKAWREQNGGFWKGKKLPAEAIAKREENRRKKSQRIKVTAPDGTVEYYQAPIDASRGSGVAGGSISYAMDRHNGLHVASGYIFQRITDEEYRQNRK